MLNIGLPDLEPTEEDEEEGTLQGEDEANVEEDEEHKLKEPARTFLQPKAPSLAHSTNSLGRQPDLEITTTRRGSLPLALLAQRRGSLIADLLLSKEKRRKARQLNKQPGYKDKQGFIWRRWELGGTSPLINGTGSKTKEDEVMEAPSLTVTEPDTSSLRSYSMD